MDQIKDLKIQDISHFDVEISALSGKRRKVYVKDKHKKYMLKLADIKQNGEQIPSHISEYTSCKLIDALGYSVQEVCLVTWHENEAVLIELFDEQIVTFTGFGDSTLESGNLEYDLDSMADGLVSAKFAENPVSFLWNTFILDSFVCNLDRHPNNWGFFRKGDVYSPAPLFDLGNSLFSVNANKLNKNTDVNKLIELYGKSAILYRGERLGFRDVLRARDNEHLQKALAVFKTKLNAADTKKELRDILANVLLLNKEYDNYCEFLEQMIDAQTRFFEETL
ncbi:MAG: HipA domain-containing protein [Clostridiales Family XIII bacterium]|jgi:hypothetical protein|nr:HipA domain-containing protein [Clostridiales Family XIII bacterium]